MNIEQNGDTYSFTRSIITQIVKEQDERTMLMLEEYVKNQPDIDLSIIPEGKFRHIINLGISTYNMIRHDKKSLTSCNFLSEQVYVEYLLGRIEVLERENQKLKNQIQIESE